MSGALEMEGYISGSSKSKISGVLAVSNMTVLHVPDSTPRKCQQLCIEEDGCLKWMLISDTSVCVLDSRNKVSSLTDMEKSSSIIIGDRDQDLKLNISKKKLSAQRKPTRRPTKKSKPSSTTRTTKSKTTASTTTTTLTTANIVGTDSAKDATIMADYEQDSIKVIHPTSSPKTHHKKKKQPVRRKKPLLAPDSEDSVVMLKDENETGQKNVEEKVADTE